MKQQQFIDAIRSIIDTLEKDADDIDTKLNTTHIFNGEEKANYYGKVDGIWHSIYVLRNQLLYPLLEEDV